MMQFIDYVVFIVSFLLGAIPFAVIIGKIFFNTDVRKQGSGNPGATNTLRILGPKAGLTVLILDILKGFMAVRLAFYYCVWPEVSVIDRMTIAGGLAILGHIFSPFLGFKGGKGVATTFGVILALMPFWFTLIVMVVFYLVLFLTKYVSLSSISAMFAFAILNFLLKEEISRQIFGICITLLIILKHRSNILRLIKGEENKFAFGKKV